MTTPQIIATVIAALFIIAVIVVVIVAVSANDDWNAEGYEMDESMTSAAEALKNLAEEAEGNGNSQKWITAQVSAIERALLARSPAQPKQKAAQPAAVVKDVLREALSWGMVYGPSIPAHQWDEMREKMVDQFVQRIAALPPVQPEGKDAERYRFVKTMSKEMLLFWRGAYGFDDAAIDAAIAAAVKDGK